MATKMRLYGFWRSSCSWRVRIALAHKGIECGYTPINLVQDGGEQHRDAFDAINSMRQVPVLEYEDAGVLRRVSQSMAILELLEELHPSPALLPTNTYLRAKTRELAEVINSGIQPFQNSHIHKKLKAEYGVDEHALTRYMVHRGLAAFGAALAEFSGRYCIGDQITFADVLLVPQLYHARRHGLDLAPFPRLLGIEQACMALPAFQAAHADRQPDAPAP